MDSTDAKMNEEPQNRTDLMDVLVVLDKWTRTCDVVLNSLEEQIKKITNNNVKAR